MDLLALSFAQLLLGFFFVGVFILICVIVFMTYMYFATTHEEYAQEDRSDSSWNDEHLNFDTVTEFRNDFS